MERLFVLIRLQSVYLTTPAVPRIALTPVTCVAHSLRLSAAQTTYTAVLKATSVGVKDTVPRTHLLLIIIRP